MGAFGIPCAENVSCERETCTLASNFEPFSTAVYDNCEWKCPDGQFQGFYSAFGTLFFAGIFVCDILYEVYFLKRKISPVMQSTGGLMWSNFTRRGLVTMASSGNGNHAMKKKPPLKGIVFDMDGTLTVPCIDFRAMYRRVLGDDHPDVVNNSPVDILHEISSWSPEKQVSPTSLALLLGYDHCTFCQSDLFEFRMWSSRGWGLQNVEERSIHG